MHINAIPNTRNILGTTNQACQDLLENIKQPSALLFNRQEYENYYFQAYLER